MTTLAQSIAKKFAYVLSAVLLFIALIICSVNLFNPVLDKHRHDFEQYASDLLQTPVTIKSVRISWFQYQPEINLNQVTVLNKDTKAPMLQVKRLSIFFSITRSLWQRNLVSTGVMVSGTEINITQNENGEVALQGFPSFGGFNNQPFPEKAKFVDVIHWLSGQSLIILRNIDLRYTSFNNQKRFITLYDLSLKNAGIQHTLLGKAILHQELPTEITLAVQWEGNDIDYMQNKTRAYIYVTGISLAQWLKGATWNGWQLNSGLVTAKVWVSWNHGIFHRVQTTLQAYALDLYSQADKSDHKINRFSGNFGWLRGNKSQAHDQIFAGDDILIDLPNHLWPVSNFYMTAASDDNGKLTPKVASVGYLDLSDVQSFISSAGLLTPDQQKMLTDLQPKGGLQNTTVIFSGAWNDWNHMVINTNFDRISLLPWKKLPGVKNLTGGLKWVNTEGDLSFNSIRTTFDYDALFANKVDIDQLTGTTHLKWDQPNNTWQISMNGMQLFNSDGAVNLTGTVKLPVNAEPILDLSSNFTMQKVNHISRYLPLHIFDSGLVKWLQDAFLAGEIKSGHAIFRGALSDFPYDKGNGTFLLAGLVKDVDLHYAPGWPTVQHVNGELTFSGRQLVVDVNGAQTLNLPLAHLQAKINSFGGTEPSVLTVQSDEIPTDFSAAMNFVHHSPLEKTLGKMFNGLELSGLVTLKLNLTVPLKNPENTQVKGELNVNDGEVNLAPWRLMIRHLKGQIQFTENSTAAKNLQAVLFNKPLQFSLVTVQKEKGQSTVQANFTNNIDMVDLENWLQIQFTKVAKGSTDLTGQVDFALNEPIKINLQSKLVGMSLDLPENYAKKPEEARDFNATLFIQANQPLRMQLNYSNLLGAALILERQGDKYDLLAANVRFGSGLATWPAGNGLYITGNFDKLGWDKIKLYSGQDNSKFSTLPLRNIDILIGELMLGGRTLKQVHFVIKPEDKNWNINVTSPDLAGSLIVPASMDRRSMITAQFQKIIINSAYNSVPNEALIDIKTIPSISFSASNVIYNGMSLGQIVFKAVPSGDGMNIQQLQLSSRYAQLKSSGEWTQMGKTYATRLHGNMMTDHLSDLLSTFGFDVHNFVSSTGQIYFDLNWHDAPFSPSLDTLGGTMSLALGAGRIVDIGQENGAKMGLAQLLSIFSLQSIPQHLASGFSDVFQKGYSFKSIRGDFSLDKGDVYTSNLILDGTIALVAIDGHFGLKDKTLNFILSVKPYNVTSPLPLAATLVGGPLVGLGALAVNSVIGAQLSKATTYKYQVTGPWSNPNFQPINVSPR